MQGRMNADAHERTWTDNDKVAKGVDGEFMQNEATVRSWVATGGIPGPSGAGGLKADAV